MTTRSSPSSRCTSSTGLPGSYGISPASGRRARSRRGSPPGPRARRELYSAGGGSSSALLWRQKKITTPAAAIAPSTSARFERRCSTPAADLGPLLRVLLRSGPREPAEHRVAAVEDRHVAEATPVLEDAKRPEGRFAETRDPRAAWPRVGTRARPPITMPRSGETCKPGSGLRRLAVLLRDRRNGALGLLLRLSGRARLGTRSVTAGGLRLLRRPAPCARLHVADGRRNARLLQLAGRACARPFAFAACFDLADCTGFFAAAAGFGAATCFTPERRRRSGAATSRTMRRVAWTRPGGDGRPPRLRELLRALVAGAGRDDTCGDSGSGLQRRPGPDRGAAAAEERRERGRQRHEGERLERAALRALAPCEAVALAALAQVRAELPWAPAVAAAVELPRDRELGLDRT